MLARTLSGILLALALAAILPAPGPPRAVADAAWREVPLGAGVVWRSRVYPSLFGGRQSVNVVEVRRGAPADVRALVPGGGRAKAPVSAIAAGPRALAAVNGGYFGGAGESYSLVKAGGRILGRNAIPRTALGILPGGGYLLRVVPSPDPFLEAADAIGGGPRLLAAGRIGVRWAEEGFRAGSGIGIFAPSPRTAAGITASGTLLLVTVDGRSAAGRGMTLDELARYLLWLGARDAVNLDGGGSTTCFVRGRGAVNRPSDGRERAVASALAVVPR